MKMLSTTTDLETCGRSMPGQPLDRMAAVNINERTKTASDLAASYKRYNVRFSYVALLLNQTN